MHRIILAELELYEELKMGLETGVIINEYLKTGDRSKVTDAIIARILHCESIIENIRNAMQSKTTAKNCLAMHVHRDIEKHKSLS